MITHQIQHEMGGYESYYLLNVMVVNRNAEVCLLLEMGSENRYSHLCHRIVEVGNLGLVLEGCVILGCFRFLTVMNADVALSC